MHPCVIIDLMAASKDGLSIFPSIIQFLRAFCNIVKTKLEMIITGYPAVLTERPLQYAFLR